MSVGTKSVVETEVNEHIASGLLSTNGTKGRHTLSQIVGQSVFLPYTKEHEHTL